MGVPTITYDMVVQTRPPCKLGEHKSNVTGVPLHWNYFISLWLIYNIYIEAYPHCAIFGAISCFIEILFLVQVAKG